ncbi:SRPBCC family protein [Nocardia donostiensis]|uniref:Transcriptional regulator n=1 Tax=Nocardia donostiensis TaxID=1538463 RepID=A0A1W0AY50_9NOCA|nr:SRPBCC family protein [Nocardia donostiensis]ONM47158.1 transcriptional regulator [Nocardia donostiensis]OQS15171.1 transcriptional regulator [Nocardia donostiensis]OQS20143.1 transcriptional regulator [Nocardia donostiensis]
MAEFEVVRQITIAAEPARVHGLINDFHNWAQWSPWEDLDPELRRMYSGPDTGTGARYAWEGNRKAGSGTMEITSSSDREIRVRVSFERPWRATNTATFTLNPATTGGTDVVWRMNGEQTGVMALLGRVMPMDRLVGKDFEKGLARLRAAAEAAAD